MLLLDQIYVLIFDNFEFLVSWQTVKMIKSASVDLECKIVKKKK